MVQALSSQFILNRNRSRDKDSRSDATSEPTRRTWAELAAGGRYAGCTFENYEATTAEQRRAVMACKHYVTNAGRNIQEGRGLIFIGPKGTGKDHLLMATLSAIVSRYGLDRPSEVCSRYTKAQKRIRVVDGMTLLDRYRDEPSHKIEGPITEPSLHLLAISDPVPPVGALPEWDQRRLFRIVDQRYRIPRPTLITINVASRKEMEQRIGPSTADRLCHGSVNVVCNWRSYRE